MLLARASSARAECANSFSWTDVVGIAADGSYVTRTRYDVSMGAIDVKHMSQRIEWHAADASLVGAISWCAPDSMDPLCPTTDAAVDANGDAPSASWHLEGHAPPELIAGAPTADQIIQQLGKRLALVPATSAPSRVRLTDAFVRVDHAVVKVMRGRDLVGFMDQQPVHWRARLLVRPGTPTLLLELVGRDLYSAYGGSCGYDVRSIEAIPPARLGHDDGAYAFHACFDDDTHYDSVYGSLSSPLACVVDLRDEHAITALAALPADPADVDGTGAPSAAAGVASRTSDRLLLAMLHANRPVAQAFAYRALGELAAWSTGRTRTRVGRKAAVTCLDALPFVTGDVQAAALTCVDQTKAWLSVEP